VNVFTQSLLRDYSAIDLKKEFDSFVQKAFNQYEEFFEIIDIKYLTCDYFFNHNNIEYNKRRSIRKQFVYEHLLQKSLEHRDDPFKNLSIRSSFWLPSYDPNSPDFLKEEIIFMNDYIKLKNVNFTFLADIYWQF